MVSCYSSPNTRRQKFQFSRVRELSKKCHNTKSYSSRGGSDVAMKFISAAGLSNPWPHLHPNYNFPLRISGHQLSIVGVWMKTFSERHWIFLTWNFGSNILLVLPNLFYNCMVFEDFPFVLFFPFFFLRARPTTWSDNPPISFQHAFYWLSQVFSLINLLCV